MKNLSVKFVQVSGSLLASLHLPPSTAMEPTGLTQAKQVLYHSATPRPSFNFKTGSS